MVKTALRTLAVLGSLCAACQGDSLEVGGDQVLEREDVEGLPPGDASGDAASGAFIVGALEQRSCRCDGPDEFGLCDLSLGATGIWLVQDDGALQLQLLDALTALEDIVLEGGIDSDGAFVVGGVNELALNGVRLTQSFDRATGVVRPNDGGQIEWVRRSRSLAGDGSDCTITLDMEFSWWDPDDVGACTLALQCHPSRPYCSNFVCTDGSPGTSCGLPPDCASGICVNDICVTGAAGSMCTFNSDCLSRSCSAETCD